MPERENTSQLEDHEIKQVEMVDVSRVSTVFEDQSVLTAVADKLLRKGLISGYEISPATSGYAHEGRQVSNDKQFRLEILCADPEKSSDVRRLISEEIGRRWDVPKITEDQIQVNKDLVGFIKNVEREHKRFLNQKRLTRAVALTTLLSLGGVITSLIRQHAESVRQDAVTAEQANFYKKIMEMEIAIQDKVLEIEEKERAEVPLTKIPPAEFGVETFEETREILEITRDATNEVTKLINAGK